MCGGLRWGCGLHGIGARFLAAGDTALTVEFGVAGGPGTSGQVLALYLRIKDAGLPGVVEVVPAIRSLTVHYDPRFASGGDLRALIEPLVGLDAGGEEEREPGLLAGARRWLVPACYAPEEALDVGAVAEACRLSPWQVTALHACVSYRVVMVGFLPGQPYLGDLPPPLRVPRRVSPRTAVAAGSIAIAGAMSVIYPFQSPGGWNIIGRTPVRWFDAERDEPALLAPGDEVRFRAIDRDELDALTRAAASGHWMLEPEAGAG